MITVGFCGLALIQWQKLVLIASAIQTSSFGYLWTTIEIVVFGGLVWALVSCRANTRKAQEDQFTQRLRARQKELTLK